MFDADSVRQQHCIVCFHKLQPQNWIKWLLLHTKKCNTNSVLQTVTQSTVFIKIIKYEDDQKSHIKMKLIKYDDYAEIAKCTWYQDSTFLRAPHSIPLHQPTKTLLIIIFILIIIMMIMMIKMIMLIRRTGKMSVEATRSKQRRWHHSTSANLVIIIVDISLSLWCWWRWCWRRKWKWQSLS